MIQYVYYSLYTYIYIYMEIDMSWMTALIYIYTHLCRYK